MNDQGYSSHLSMAQAHTLLILQEALRSRQQEHTDNGTNFIPDRSRPGLTTTAIGAVDLQGAGGNWATVGRRSRGGRRVHRQREKRKGKGRELADMMERRKVDILCVQETRWKGSKAHSIGAGFKLFYYGVDSKRNGVGVVLKEEFVRNVLEVGCELEEKERFWSELDEVMESIPTGERVVIGADFNGHVGEGNTGDEEVMGKFGVKERNLEGQMVVDFAKRMDMGVVNTYFQKREEHRVTYKSGAVMEYWRQCAHWLIRCRVLPQSHRVTWETARAFDLAQSLRDGVLLCQLLNNLHPQTINLKEINLRPQMSQQDNDPKHTSKSTSEWLKKNKMKTLEWPSQSPDLNPIEMLWHDLQKVVHARKPSNVAELQQFCKDEWAKIPPQSCNRLIVSYGKRLIAVVAAKGGPTSY
ncbi:hypothetical protein QTP70_012456 [Hemibagrus guttatus]|uniref:Calponin-homology (CH) domain-containing protein n=1 Tax=Hemibagrus guttatus TaxID=175788 RepID=A0AAE0RDR3_9TELE|nr:hypothetical protein QTP70_012456 [Hemibagrus guttatus]